MNYIRIILSAALGLSLWYCTNIHTLEKSVIDLHDQLMALHDSTMNQYEISGSLIEKLKKRQHPGDSAESLSLDSIRTKLDRSNETMMDWMANYHDPETKDSAALHYLSQQFGLLQQFAMHQKQNIQQAKTILLQSTR